jgi:hypothetical protein
MDGYRILENGAVRDKNEARNAVTLKDICTGCPTHTVEVAGSNPAPPIRFATDLRQFVRILRAFSDDFVRAIPYVAPPTYLSESTSDPCTRLDVLSSAAQAID